MTGPSDEHNSPEYDDLDAILDIAMTGILASLDSGFDPDAGLADIYARNRASTAQADTPLTPRDAESPVGQPQDQQAQATATQLVAVCEQIDNLDDCLAFIIRAALAQPFAGAAYLEMARPALAQLRRGLANRLLAREHAEQAVDKVRSLIGQAESIIARQEGRTLAQAIRATAGELAEFGGPLPDQIHALHHSVMRLYAESGYVPSFV